MYDKSHERFHKMDMQEKNEFYLKLINSYKITSLKETYNGGENNVLTEITNGQLQMKSKRPALLVSRFLPNFSCWCKFEIYTSC